MIDTTLKKLRDLLKTKRSVVLCLGAAIIIVGLVAASLTFGGNSQHNAAASAPNGHSTANKSTKAGMGSSLTAASSDTKNSPLAPTPGAPTTAVLKTTTNSDGTTTKEVASYVSVPFSVQTQNDVNLKRGVTAQAQAGQNGIETIMYSVTYDQNGKEISRKTVSDTVTKQSVAQIMKIGVSDYNLNTDTWDGTEFGDMCLPTDYSSGADGCIGVPSDQHFSAVSISGTYYVYCIGSASGVCAQNAIVNVQPIIAVHGDNTFSYQGTTYRADPRAGGGMSQLLTSAICLQYGLACGSW
jgi:hypothetical protein